ncbi:MAG: hypothetical protein R3D27_14670 [Hyphomicrobiaceae bacterium]
MRRRFMKAMALVAALGLPVAVGAAGGARAIDKASSGDTARFLAGIAPSAGSALVGAAGSGGFKRHARSFDSAWASLEKRQLSKIRAWSKENLTGPSATMLYLFSGPDYLYAQAFYPHAKTYVFAGLEPIGDEPDLANMNDARRARGLQHLQSSINSVLNLSFFKTREMRMKLSGQGFPGTIPVLMTFIARAGGDVESVTRMKLEDDGKLTEAAKGASANVARIVFTAPGSQDKRTLYYFSTDISNSGLRKSGFATFVKAQGAADALVKSASYLMHNSSFSDTRALLLGQAKRLVQDDSGVPLRNIDKTVFDITPYGNYTGPIPLFSGQYQRDMAQLFKAGKRRPLPFGMGYRYRPGDTSIILAVKK